MGMCIEVISEVTYTYIDLRTLAVTLQLLPQSKTISPSNQVYIDLRTLAVTLKLLPRSKAISPSNQRKFVTTCIYSNIIMS